MTKAQKAYRFVSVLAAMLACAWLLGSFSMLHQGEGDHPVGFAIIWAARLGTLGFATAAALAAVAPKAALRTLCASALAAMPLATFFLFPGLWCLLLVCGPNTDQLFWDAPVLIFFAALLFAIGGMQLSRPQ